MMIPHETHAAELTAVKRKLDRERRARREAESIAEQALRDVYEKHQALLRATAERERLEKEHTAHLRAEQLRVVQVTMRTVHDIVNNCLNQLQLLRYDAEGHVSDESLAFFDEAIRDTAAKFEGARRPRGLRREADGVGTEPRSRLYGGRKPVKLRLKTGVWRTSASNRREPRAHAPYGRPERQSKGGGTEWPVRVG